MEFIPREVLQHHIFGYFSLNDQISRLIAVCKLWKSIIETDNTTPKQLILHYPSEEASNVRLIQKYQPSILQINGQLPELKFALPRLVGASKRINTLILGSANPERIAKAKCLQQITTLALTGNVHMIDYDWSIADAMKLFPNLKRLQSSWELVWGDSEAFNQLEELTLFSDPEHVPDAINIPMVRICEDGVIWEKRFTEAKVVMDPSTLSYEQYFRYLGQTKLYTALKCKDYQFAAKLLSTVTSMEYERYLHYDLQYEFPTDTSDCYKLNFSYDDYVQFILSSDDKIFDEAYHALIETKLMEVPLCIMFNTLAEKDARSAVKLLEKMTDDELRQRPVVEAFCQLLDDNNISSNYFRKGKLRAAAKEIVTSKWFLKTLSSARQFQKIWFLWKYRNFESAKLSDPQLFLAMINKGFYVSKDDVIHIMHKNEWTDVQNQLMKYEFHLSEYNDNPHMVKSSELQRVNSRAKSVGSLFNYLIRSDRMIGYLKLKNFKHLINHMDSSGTTPLISLIDSDICDEAVLKKMMKLGADPNLHHQSKHSPIVRICLSNFSISNKNDCISLLIEYGGDINAPCWYNKRMCSPLMIAVLRRLPEKILWDLIAMGAKLDYTDVNGKTVLDYAKEGYNERIVKELRFFA